MRKLTKTFENYAKNARNDRSVRGPLAFLKEILLVTLINFKEIRLRGVFAAVLTVFLPVGIVVFLSIAQPNLPMDLKMRFIIGNVMVAIMQTCVGNLGGKIAQIKWYGGSEYYYVLPINRIALMYGILINSLIMTIPGVLAVLLAGSLFYGVTYSFHPILILLFVEIVLAFCGIGFLFGMKSKHPGQATAFSQAATFFLMFGTPVYYSAYSLPVLYRKFISLMPTPYATDAFLKIVLNNVDLSIWTDILALGIFSCISMFIISRATKWTEN